MTAFGSSVLEISIHFFFMFFCCIHWLLFFLHTYLLPLLNEKFFTFLDDLLHWAIRALKSVRPTRQSQHGLLGQHMTTQQNHRHVSAVRRFLLRHGAREDGVKATVSANVDFHRQSVVDAQFLQVRRYTRRLEQRRDRLCPASYHCQQQRIPGQSQ